MGGLIMESIEIKDPIPCPQAFHEITNLAEYSRAAFLLSLGTFLNPPSYPVREDLLETAPFELPEIIPSPTRFKTEELLNLFRQSDFDLASFSNNETLINENGADIVDQIYTSPPAEQWLSTFKLLALFMIHPNELLRVSAAISWLDTVTDPSRAMEILIAAVNSEFELVRDMAYTALARVISPTTAIQGVGSVSSGAQPTVSKVKSFIVHGSIFSHPGQPIEQWWEPGAGDFHNYLKNGPRPHVFDSPDYFWWSGGWNDIARSEGVEKLVKWIDKNNMHGAEAFAHSHGCNVTMLATWHKKFGTLILLSCPVHWNLYQPNFNNVGRVLSMRVVWDFVILADKGGQRFNDPRIKEIVLPLWFTKHQAPRQSSVWQSQKLHQYL